MTRSPRWTLLAALTVLLALCSSGVALAHDGDRGGHGGAGPDVYTLPDGAILPEGIARDGHSDTFFVSSVATGEIFKGDLDGPALVPFAPAGADGRIAATGMQSDGRGRLFVAGAFTGKAFVLGTRDGSTLKVLDGKPGASPTFINDVTLTDGFAYFTDSFRPVVLRVARHGGDIGELEPWLDLTGTPFVYQDSFNANGIVDFDDGRVLVIVQANTGKLFRVDTSTREVSQIDLGGATVVNGDGLVAHGRRLFVVQNADKQITAIKLRGDLRTGRVDEVIALPGSLFPTTAIKDGRRLLYVNSQLDNPGPAWVTPFTIGTVDVR